MQTREIYKTHATLTYGCFYSAQVEILVPAFENKGVKIRTIKDQENLSKMLLVTNNGHFYNENALKQMEDALTHDGDIALFL